MKDNLQSDFHPRQYMVSQDFEIYYYNNRTTPPRVDMHTHNYYEFYLFLEGNVDMQIGSESYPLQYGDLILIPPKQPHRVNIRNMDIPYRRFVFWISQEYCQHLNHISPAYTYLQQYVQHSGIHIFHNDPVSFNAIQSRILRLIEEQRSHKFGRDAQISLCVNDLVMHLNRLIYERNNPEKEQSTESLYQNVVAYIERNLDEDLSLDALAREFYVSKYHIAHMFKNNLGISVHQYITKKRLEACREAIRSGKSITQTYRVFGFGDYSCFYRAFKKEYGMSPKDCQETLAPD